VWSTAGRVHWILVWVADENHQAEADAVHHKQWQTVDQPRKYDKDEPYGAQLSKSSVLMKGWLTENSLQLENILNVFLHKAKQIKGRLGLVVFEMNIKDVI